MKTTVKTIVLAAASVFAAMSCQKETTGTQDLVKEGETIQVNINASLGDLVAADGTKATATQVVRLTWESGDQVNAYYGADQINTNPISVTPSENGIFAKLTGNITAPSGHSFVDNDIITFVYSNVTPETGGLTFNFSSQDDKIPFVAYATIKYSDLTSDFSGKMVEFKFATSVMKIAATNLGGGEITEAKISGINTKVNLSPSTSDAAANIVSGDVNGAITKTAGFEASSDKTRAIVTVGLVPDNNTGRNITVTQTDFTNKGVITSAAIHSSTSYTTPATLFTCGTLGSDINAHDYVLIAGTKWATRNIGATEDTGTNSYGKYFAWGDIVGQTWDGSSWDGGGFSTTPSIGDPKMLPLEKDAANVLWGDPWRMPTLAEFKALKEATYWAWDSTDKGYYVYAPKDGDAGKVNYGTGSYTKTDALLFFPAAGSGNGTGRNYAGSIGSYWSSSRYADAGYAYGLGFPYNSVNPQGYNYRSNGFSVRPVSD